MINEIYTWFQGQFQTNEIFQGLVGGSLFASGLYLLRGLPEQIYKLYLLRFTCEITVYSEDDSFKWVCDWLAKQPYASTAKRLIVQTITNYDSNDEDRNRWVISPGQGNHFFWFKKVPMLLNRQVREGGDYEGRLLKETISIRSFIPSQKLLREVLEEAKELQEGQQLIRVFSWNSSYWNEITSKYPRDIDTLVLKGGQIQSIVDDLNLFYNSRDWYRERGIPWHRGYLFAGEPGTGKSTLAFVLASHFNRPLYSLNLGSCEDDSSLIQALQYVPSDGILLLEDIDAIQSFAGVEHRNGTVQSTKEKKSAKRKA